jgi:hypothetical protein
MTVGEERQNAVGFAEITTAQDNAFGWIEPNALLAWDHRRFVSQPVCSTLTTGMRG